MRVIEVFALILAGGLGLTAAAGLSPDPSIPMTIQTVSRVMNFTNTYSMEYFSHNLGGVQQVRFTLRLKNVNITTWNSQGRDGIWLGLGFGKEVMEGSDIVQC